MTTLEAATLALICTYQKVKTSTYGRSDEYQAHFETRRRGG
jgi:hypothetical protein